MIPPLPPSMPPWPGGKPPWELIREAQQQQEGQQGAAGQQPQPQEQQPQQQQSMLPQMMGGFRQPVLHGLVPPHMLSPTYPTWITPPQYFRPVPPMQQPVPQQPQPAPLQQAAPQPQPQSTAGPVRVARTEEQPSDPQPFRPVMPVAHPGLPFGARERHYWHRGHP